jgi:hypothetical protein
VDLKTGEMGLGLFSIALDAAPGYLLSNRIIGFEPTGLKS